MAHFDQRLKNDLTRNVELASDAIGGLLAELFTRQFSLLQVDLSAMGERLRSRKDIIDRIGRGLVPNPDDMNVLMLFGAIP